VSGGRASRQKGNAAERVPLSGASRGRFGGDVSVPLLGIDHRIEVKLCGGSFRELHKWLDRADLMIVRADRRELLVVIPFSLAIEIARAAERAKEGAS
jgi:hypothetical protein